MKLNSITEEMKIKIEERISQIEHEISNNISEKYVEDIVATLKKLGGDGHKWFWKKGIVGVIKKEIP